MEIIHEIAKSITKRQGLKESEQERFLLAERFSENGFSLVGLVDGYLLFSVPPQDTSLWYKDNGWPSDEKNKQAEIIARKHNLEIYTPPDEKSAKIKTSKYHHLEFGAKMSSQRRAEVIASAHHHYLKIANVDSPFLCNIPEVFESLECLYFHPKSH